MAATLRNPPARPPRGKAPSRMNRLITFGLLHSGPGGSGASPTPANTRLDLSTWRRPARTERRSTVQRRKKNSFFATFKAGMLLKTHESRTKYTNFERAFSTKMRGFCNIRNELLGFCNVRGESRGLFGRQVSTGRCRVLRPASVGRGTRTGRRSRVGAFGCSQDNRPFTWLKTGSNGRHYSTIARRPDWR